MRKVLLVGVFIAVGGPTTRRIKKITAPDFTVTVRPGMPSLLVIDEEAVPSVYWHPVAPRLKRQELLIELKHGPEITGVTLSNPEPVLSVRTR